MNKLMFVAAGVAVAGSAFAEPLVYDYKASLKHIYLKETSVKYNNEKIQVYTKYQKSTSLKGYLVMDNDGVTSPTIMNNAYPNLGYTTPSTGYDYGRNRGFLVVQNNSAWTGVRTPKIIPAVLDAKWLDTSFSKSHTATSGIAEGTLYAGGDAVMPVRPQLDLLKAGVAERKDENDNTIIPLVPYVDDNGTKVIQHTATPDADVNYTGMVAFSDYVWTSIYLFAGSSQKDAYFNGPNWFPNVDGYSPFGQFELAWDQNLPALLKTGWKAIVDEDTQETLGYQKEPNNYFHDTWMNGAGIGKWTKGKITTKYCCGIKDKTGNADYVLDSLSGNLKGGLFLCTENGILVGGDVYGWFDGIAWEDQFNTSRIGTGLFAADSWQNDLWQDGFVEQETTDVLYGTWSIKINTKLLASDKKTFDSKSSLWYVIREYDDNTGDLVKTTTWGKTALTADLIDALYSAAYKLNKKVNFADGTEIYSYATQPTEQGDIPMITPQFAAFYRLVYGPEVVVEY